MAKILMQLSSIIKCPLQWGWLYYLGLVLLMPEALKWIVGDGVWAAAPFSLQWPVIDGDLAGTGSPYIVAVTSMLESNTTFLSSPLFFYLTYIPPLLFLSPLFFSSFPAPGSFCHISHLLPSTTVQRFFLSPGSAALSLSSSASSSRLPLIAPSLFPRPSSPLSPSPV